MKMFLLCLVLFGVIACESNPYPTDDDLTKNRRPSNSERDVATGLFVPTLVNIDEGKKLEQKIKFTLPEGHKEIIEVEGLPSGAVFNNETYIISWTPTFFSGNDLTDPRINQQNYDVKIRLFTIEDGADAPNENDAKHITMTIAVHDVPQAFEIVGRSSKTVTEGDTLTYEFEIENFDYPEGPFEVSIEGFPANTQIKEIEAAKYQLIFSPDYHHVKNTASNVNCSSRTNCRLRYDGQIFIGNPANYKVKKDVVIDVLDKRQKVTLVTPQSMEQGLDISFQVTAFDPNGEIAPSISFDGTEPKDGIFTTSIDEDSDNYSSVLSVNWKDIPISYKGKSFNFPFESCVLKRGSRGSYNECSTASFRVEIVTKTRMAPTFSRSTWQTGEIKYLKHRESETYRIKIRDGDNNSRLIDSIKIVPSEMSKYVDFNRDRLTVQFDKPGLHQFSIVATSEYGMSTAQSFVADVFKKERSKTIYLTNTHKDPEAKFFTKNMTNVELLNPYFQRMDKRMLSGRDNLILGTNILQDTEFIDTIEEAMSNIDNVIIASPMIKNMPKTFLEELHSVYKVAIDGRYNDISKTPLSEMRFISRTDFENSSDIIGLKQTTTSESANPLIFSIGVDRQDCQDVLDLTDKNKTLRYKMGIICDRQSGGRYAILGTEFSDFKTTETDKDIPAKWLERMLSTNLNDKKNQGKK
jgi:hypothetical protein